MIGIFHAGAQHSRNRVAESSTTKLAGAQPHLEKRGSSLPWPLNRLEAEPAGTDSQLPLPSAPPAPKAPALVKYKPPVIGSSRIEAALSALSVFLASNIVRVTSGDRNFVPKGGARDSAHLTREAADFHVIGVSDSRAYQVLKDSGSPLITGFRLIEHGTNTVTQGAHLHLDARNKVGQRTIFMYEGRNPSGRAVYTVDKTPAKPTSTSFLGPAFWSLLPAAFGAEADQPTPSGIGSQYYPLAQGSVWTYWVFTGPERRRSAVEWRVTCTATSEEGLLYEVWPTPADDDDDVMLLHESPEGIEETDDGDLILPSSITTGQKWAAGEERRFRIVSAGQRCNEGPVRSRDCAMVEEEDDATHLRIVTTYAKGVGPIGYKYFRQDAGDAGPVETVELRSYHLSSR